MQVKRKRDEIEIPNPPKRLCIENAFARRITLSIIDHSNVYLKILVWLNKVKLRVPQERLVLWKRCVDHIQNADFRLYQLLYPLQIVDVASLIKYHKLLTLNNIEDKDIRQFAMCCNKKDWYNNLFEFSQKIQIFLYKVIALVTKNKATTLETKQLELFNLGQFLLNEHTSENNTSSLAIWCFQTVNNLSEHEYNKQICEVLENFIKSTDIDLITIDSVEYFIDRKKIYLQANPHEEQVQQQNLVELGKLLLDRNGISQAMVCFHKISNFYRTGSDEWYQYLEIISNVIEGYILAIDFVHMNLITDSLLEYFIVVKRLCINYFLEKNPVAGKVQEQELYKLGKSLLDCGGASQALFYFQKTMSFYDTGSDKWYQYQEIISNVLEPYVLNTDREDIDFDVVEYFIQMKYIYVGLIDSIDKKRDVFFEYGELMLNRCQLYSAAIVFFNEAAKLYKRHFEGLHHCYKLIHEKINLFFEEHPFDGEEDRDELNIYSEFVCSKLHTQLASEENNSSLFAEEGSFSE